MEMAAQRCSHRSIHDVHGRVVVTSSSRHHHDSLHGHGLVGALAALPSIQCLQPWPSKRQPAVVWRSAVWKGEEGERCARTGRGADGLKGPVALDASVEVETPH
jgi:hypothetical protein